MQNMVGVNAAAQSEDGRTPLHLASLRMSLQQLADSFWMKRGGRHLKLANRIM